MDHELVSIRKLASSLDCSPKTVRDWMYRNRREPVVDPLPYYRVGGLIRFCSAEVAAWVERRRVRVTSFGSHAAGTLSAVKTASRNL
jgi:predicted DNA-binding transcriptional regulator AlpA